MARRVLFVLLPALLIAVCMWFWPREETDTPDLPKAEDVMSAGSRGVAESGATREARAASRVAEPVAPSAEAPSAPPIPADAPAYEVLVVDQESNHPVADADVWWGDDSTMARAPYVPFSVQPFRLNDSEQLVRTYGWHTRSDAHGRARVAGRVHVGVHARAGPRYGSIMIREGEPAPADGHRVLLRTDLALQVRVVDGHGAAVAGVPLCIAQHASDGRFLRLWPYIDTRSEAPDGIAWFAHLQGWRLRDREQPPTAQWRVRTRLPGYADPGMVFDPRSPPPDPIVLQLPPCGSLVLRLEHAGRPLPQQRGQGPRVQLEAAGGRADAGVFDWQQWADTGAEVRFAAVPVGRTLTAHVRWLGVHHEQAIVGPGVAGQEVTAVVRLADDLVGLAGRLLGPDRQPLRDTTANVDLQTSMVGGNAQLSTDGEGRFLLLLGRPDPTAEIERFTLWRQELGGPMLRAELAAQKLKVGITEVGDLVFRPDPTGRSR